MRWEQIVTQSLTGVAVLVPDYDPAIAFFTTVLRFVLAEDVAQGGGKRWARVVPCAVHFREAPRHGPYGTVAVFEDPWGNPWDLIQRGAGDSAGH
jgi:catechol 2,3-dioxygenase-like lactoylglutathione lyase family enzyme